jgi:hypothetical protein
MALMMPNCRLTIKPVLTTLVVMSSARYADPQSVRLLTVDVTAMDTARLPHEARTEFIRAAIRQFTTLRLLGLCGAVLSMIEAKQREVPNAQGSEAR